MSTPIREHPGHKVIKAKRQLEWRFHTLEEDFDDAMALQEPQLEEQERAFHFSRRDQIYEAEKLLHHYLSGYYTFWRQVLTVGHATEDPECRGRIEKLRSQHDENPSARITRGLRMYVQKENVLPLLIYQSDHDDSTPKYAINKNDIQRDGLYDPNFEHYFGEVDGVCIFPFEVIEQNWRLVNSLYSRVIEKLSEHMDDELAEYRDELEELDDAYDRLPYTDILEELLPLNDPLEDDLLED